MIFIFITLFLDLLGSGLLVPVIPFLVREYSKDALTIGLLAVSFSAAQFIASPVLGVLSDRYGRRPVLLISLLGTTLGYFIFGFANALWLLFAARLLDGFTGGNISTAQAYIADISPPQDRAKNFGLIGAAFGLGFIFGPALGGLLGQISLQAPAFAAGILSLATTIFGFFALPESLPPQKRLQRPIRLKELNPIAQVGDVLQRPVLRGLLLANFAKNFAFSGLQTNFALFTFVRFGLGSGANGAIFSYIGVLAALMQGLIVRRLVKHFREEQLAVVGFGMMAVGFSLISFVPTIWMLYPALTFIPVGSGLVTPTLMGLISKQVAIQEQGTILGASQAIASLTQVVAPVWAGAVFDYVGIGAPYWTGAIWLVVAVWLVATCQIKTER
ncbi:MAG: MFS transporter [Mojavia pulchra JT2-VF2]|uniref:MFS transporter n=1 Tax=Mojavia pulchra JT2-VF2 TaxID=287848 RepID=A0A951PWI0_9NOST|nr:MFS transporter [Mojavia pulchra JT2-VF2]